MSAAPQPIAVLGDTVTLVIALFAARYLLLALRGETRWGQVAATWLRRIAAVAVILLALRLFTIAAVRPEIAGIVAAVGAALVLGIAAMLVADTWIVRMLEPWVRRRRRRP